MEKYIDLGRGSQKTLGLPMGWFMDPEPLQPQGIYLHKHVPGS